MASTQSSCFRIYRRTFSVVPSPINLSNSSFVVWGAGTNVGKTLISAAYAYYAEKFEVNASLLFFVSSN